MTKINEIKAWSRGKVCKFKVDHDVTEDSRINVVNTEGETVLEDVVWQPGTRNGIGIFTSGGYLFWDVLPYLKDECTITTA